MNLSAIINWFTSFIPGSRLVDGGDCYNLATIVCGTATNITAHAGGGQAAATQLNARFNEVDTVATAADSVKLPLAIPGALCSINNAGANSAQVFGQSTNPQNGGAGDTIAPYNSSAQAATGTGVAHAANACYDYICTTLGQWKQR